MTDLIENGKASNAVRSEEEQRNMQAKQAEMQTAAQLQEEVVHLREKMKSAEENFIRLETS